MEHIVPAPRHGLLLVAPNRSIASFRVPCTRVPARTGTGSTPAAHEVKRLTCMAIVREHGRFPSRFKQPWTYVKAAHKSLSTAVTPQEACVTDVTHRVVEALAQSPPGLLWRMLPLQEV